MRNPKLTIGMACFDDFDGVYFTITSLMLHHAEAMRDCEIVVIDNNPDSDHGQSIAKWVRTRVPNGRYVRFDGPAGTALPRDEVFQQARGQSVLCIDCHVLLAPASLRMLVDYYDAHENCPDLLTGPLIHDSGSVAATHQEPKWRAGAWGVWSIDRRGKDPQGTPFEIWQQGMGLFSCHKEAWVGFHPDFRGFGGCETYIMEKFRRNGGRVLCCPWLRWTHRFVRPQGAPYQVKQRDKLRNYLVGFQELGLSAAPVAEHFKISLDEARLLAQPAKPQSLQNHLAILGRSSFAGTRMRGRLLSRHLSVGIHAPERLRHMPNQNTIVAIKTGFEHRLLRSKCDRLIHDPLDSFAGARTDGDPIDYWRTFHRQHQYDDILATSPACYDIMREAHPDSVNVHLVPHQCDPRIREDARDPDGPVVYVGLERFITSGQERMRKACRKIGKKLVISRQVRALQGASLVLALRLPPYATPINRHCKPQIKLENAAAAGLPVVATDCPASTSLHPGIETVPVDFSVSELANAMQRALKGPGLSNPYTDSSFLNAMDQILDQPRKVVYTAIFGGYDKLHEPQMRSPGVQYICFTDNPYLKSRVWRIHYCKPTGDPLFQAKRLKVLAHEALDCDMSLWIDGRIELHDLNGVFEWASSDLAVQEHPKLNCIYDEATLCLETGRGDPSRITAAIARYRDLGHPANGGMWLGGIVFRKHTPQIAKFNNEWWQEIIEGTSRDQLSLSFLLRSGRFPFQTLSHDGPCFALKKHLIRR